MTRSTLAEAPREAGWKGVGSGDEEIYQFGWRKKVKRRQDGNSLKGGRGRDEKTGLVSGDDEGSSWRDSRMR
ncbi:hypothetical protein GWI33_014656 [Rhynchophorus ferrugineus]|uniref:Uncharacterized protein n=1 Tax=Rhynchophorus ferrugineus TaxID=354439 RepID=A0A834I6N0_RHYFE|nr:hypothetical protein GWI33_014656 [Rhynchophorus ferrugineus]